MICTYMDNCLISYIYMQSLYIAKAQKATATDKLNSVVQRCLLAYLIPITPWVTLRLAIFLPRNPTKAWIFTPKSFALRSSSGQRRYQSTSDGFGCSTLCCKWFLFFFFGRGQKRGSGEASLCRCPWWFENEGLAGCAAIFMAFVGLRGLIHKSWNVPPKNGKVSRVSSLISVRFV